MSEPELIDIRHQNFMRDLQELLCRHQMVMFARTGRHGIPLISIAGLDGMNWVDYYRVNAEAAEKLGKGERF